MIVFFLKILIEIYWFLGLNYDHLDWMLSKKEK
jgi:hypothetical protein